MFNMTDKWDDFFSVELIGGLNMPREMRDAKERELNLALDPCWKPKMLPHYRRFHYAHGDAIGQKVSRAKAEASLLKAQLAGLDVRIEEGSCL